MHEYESLDEIRAAFPRLPFVKGGAFQYLDLREVASIIQQTRFEDCVFMGCSMDRQTMEHIMQGQGNAIFPHLDVPFRMYQAKLYTPGDLYEGYAAERSGSYADTYDKRVYDHFMAQGGAEPLTIQEALAQRIHDHSMTDALGDFIRKYDSKKIAAIMGGHALGRDAADYRKACLVSKALTERGYLMVSGGGPGAMEATHLGAWFAGRPEGDLDRALDMLSECPSYKPQEDWLATAFRVMEVFPRVEAFDSLGVPTWLYGHEPPTPFATKIAKYFANSLREEGLLAIAKGGVIYTPGSAGTMQEIFQDACQNHYVSYEFPSPMVFLNRTYWEEERPVYPLLEELSKRGAYQNLLLSIHDEAEAVVRDILAFGGKPRE